MIMVPSHLMFERLLPDGMAVSAVQGDNYDTPLLPEEECAVASAVEKRRREFAAGRACARNALAKLGMPEVAIPRGAHGEPVWPAGAVGSITHCDGFCACAVARRELIWSVGIDAEPNEPLPQGVLENVAHPAELESVLWLGAAEPSVRWDRLLFSSKEAAYKALVVMTGWSSSFPDIGITFHADGKFSAAPHDSENRRWERITEYAGNWLVSDGLILTAVVVPAAAR